MALRSTAPHGSHHADLATIVLADPSTRTMRDRAYDARSVVVLAVVVAVLAGVIAAVKTVRNEAIVTDPAHTSASSFGPTRAASSSAPSTTAHDAFGAPPRGIALGIGRITTSVDRARGALVVRVTVTNAGTNALVARTGAQLAVLIDDRVIGRVALGELAGTGAHRTYAVSTYTCTPGRHLVTAIADVTSRVRHAAGSNGARGSELAITCPD